MTKTTVPREHVWTACRRRPDVRWQERYHKYSALNGWQELSEIAQWLNRDEDVGDDVKIPLCDD